VAVQARYHRQLFPALFDWDKVWRAALDVAGDRDTAIGLAFDQLGHFGPHGVDLVIERLMATARAPLRRVVELGSGLGGVLRQLRRQLAERGHRPCVIGLELVPDHSAAADAIDRIVEGGRSPFVTADARRLPFASRSVDAFVAAGSASHFASMQRVLGECQRALRPGGVLVMIEEVSIRPVAAPAVGAPFLLRHPPDVFRAASRGQRLSELARAGLQVERFEPLRPWAVQLVRERERAIRLLGGCAIRLFGTEGYERIVATLSAAADEYERGAIEPALVVARRPAY
jgi:SAM-dependent methyltransferase